MISTQTCIRKCTKINQGGPKWTKVIQIDRIGPKWTEYDQYGPNRANVDWMDEIGLK